MVMDLSYALLHPAVFRHLLSVELVHAEETENMVAVRGNCCSCNGLQCRHRWDHACAGQLCRKVFKAASFFPESLEYSPFPLTWSGNSPPKPTHDGGRENVPFLSPSFIMEKLHCRRSHSSEGREGCIAAETSFHHHGFCAFPYEWGIFCKTMITGLFFSPLRPSCSPWWHFNTQWMLTERTRCPLFICCSRAH